MSVTVDPIKGIFEVADGQGNLNVVGQTTAGPIVMTTNVLQGSASVGVGVVNIPLPGFYQVPVSGAFGAGGFTGSLPNASSFPGADILITDTAGLYNWMLTGAISMNVSPPYNPGLQTLSSSNGTKLLLASGSTVGLWSDSKGWLVCALSGTATLKP